MGEVYVERKIKIAMAYKAEAEKIKIIKEAETHCETLYLAGVGIAGQRKALATELQKTFSDGTDARDVMNVLLLTQYLDMMTTVSTSSSSSERGDSMIVQSDPGLVCDLRRQLRALPS